MYNWRNCVELKNILLFYESDFKVFYFRAREQVQWLLFLRTWVRFLAPIWRFTAAYNSTSKGSNAVFWPPRAPGTDVALSHTHSRTRMHIRSYATHCTCTSCSCINSFLGLTNKKTVALNCLWCNSYQGSHDYLFWDVWAFQWFWCGVSINIIQNKRFCGAREMA